MFDILFSSFPLDANNALSEKKSLRSKQNLFHVKATSC